MKRINVEVRTVTMIVFEWVCPSCGKKTVLEVEGDTYENRTKQSISCKSCRAVIYRQEPGVYGTERPR